ncbi:MAG: hypothetical protein Q4G48_08640 [Bacteroidia bacterium]|nr:hypothetical protein [Bacteroidia bacterium]
MKKLFIYFLALAAFFFTACEDDKPIKEETPKGEAELLILSEGSWNGNNSTLARYNVETKELDKDYFNTINKRGLGDTGNDMLKYGSKIYIVMNVSSTIEVIDTKNGKSLRQIPMKTTDGNSKQPRRIAAHNGKVYVTSFDDTVTKIDTATYNIDATLTVGQEPEGIWVKGNKLYVSNSGGLSGYANTVSVINIATFKEESKVEVGVNPGTIQGDSEGDIYVWSGGNYADISPSFQRIDAAAGKVETVADVDSPAGFTISNDKAYIISGSYGSPYKLMVYDCKTEKVITENFVTDNTQIGIIYHVSVDDVSGDVFISETDYSVPGNVHCFDKNGKLKYSLNAVGINPKVVEVLP